MIFRIDEEAETEMAASTDRACAVIGVAYLEERLFRALKTYLVHDVRISEWLLERPGPLASFEARIRLGVAIGLVGREAAFDLLLLKDIRNAFAHRVSIKSFEEETSIRDRLGNLKKFVVGIMVLERVEKRPATARERFESAVGEAGGLLAGFSRGASRMPSPDI